MGLGTMASVQPALRSYLKRSSPLDLLRYMNGLPLHCEALPRRHLQYSIRSKRLNLSTAVAETAKREEPDVIQFPVPSKRTSGVPRISDHYRILSQDFGIEPHDQQWPNINAASLAANVGYWREDQFTSEQLEFESNLDEKSDLKKLVDHPALKDSIPLWLFLATFRHRRYGDYGLLMFWRHIQKRKIRLPVDEMSNKFWLLACKIGARSPELLDVILSYATWLYKTTGERWPRLYTTIVGMFSGDRDKALLWHVKLKKHFHPTPYHLKKLLCSLVQFKCDNEFIEELYLRNRETGMYDAVMKKLIRTQQYPNALRMHQFFMRRKDYPTNAAVVKPLQDHFAIYNHNIAVQITAGLVAANVPVDASLVAEDKVDFGITRELVNLVHGEVFHIKPKKYNDELGARWFATRWISLDVCLQAVHALGVSEIGPLSLQSVMLRDLDFQGSVHALSQLDRLGISTGNSAFATALKYFVKTGDEHNLRLLVVSDQHPDALEDRTLQQELINSYRKARDWAKLNHLAAIQLALSPRPDIEDLNMRLRDYSKRRHRIGIQKTLDEMRQSGVPVRIGTIETLIQNGLQHREKGHIPQSRRGGSDDLNYTIALLKTIIERNNLVPVTFWREILIRLGKAGRLDELDTLCLWLAQWYGPGSKLRQNSLSFTTKNLPNSGLRRIPDSVPTSHRLHPLRILFSDICQKSLIEWGFTHSKILESSTFKINRSRQLSFSDVSAHDTQQPPPATYTRGVSLLHQLAHYGVAINVIQARKAIFQRLLMLYGPGSSNRLINRRIVLDNDETIEETLEQFDRAWGEKVFESTEAVIADIRNSGPRVASVEERENPKGPGARHYNFAPL